MLLIYWKLLVVGEEILSIFSIFNIFTLDFRERVTELVAKPLRHKEK